MWQHIYGLKAKPKGALSSSDQSGKTLFVSKAAFETAWINWSEKSTQSTGVICNTYTGTLVDSVPVASVGTTSAFECVEADSNTGLCIQTVSAQPQKVMFVYGKKNNEWILLTAYPAYEECRKLSNVAQSAAGPQQNSAAGGHIWQHIYGLKAKPRGATESQDGKALFVNEAEYQRAWSAWKQMKSKTKQGSTSCGPPGSVTDTVTAASVGITSALECTEVDTAGLCTQTECVTPTKVIFRYANYKKSKNKWILNTAYPSS